ncbi:hypothetical protein HDR58_08450 [bacterium]|nr:hypothetical protein [bacterium]
MKIAPQIYNIFIPKTEVSPVSNKQSIQFSTVDKFEPSFSGVNIPKILTAAQELGSTRCPVCGVKMLSENGYESLITQAGAINSLPEFCDFLRANTDYIPKYMRNILPSKEQSEMGSIKDFISYKRLRAHGLHAQVIKHAKQYLKSFAAILQPNDKKALLLGINDIKSSELFFGFKSKVCPIINNATLEPAKRSELYQNLFPIIQDSSRYCGALNIKGFNDISESDVASAIARNLFKNAVSEVNEITSFDFYKGKPNNNVLMCKSCNSNPSKNVFWDKAKLEDSNLVKNITNYLTDLSVLMGRKLIPEDKAYLSEFCYLVNKIIKGSTGEMPLSMKRLNNLISITSRRADFSPINQAKVDVPCACCGSVMLPHSVRMIIKEELQKLKFPAEFVDLLNKYDKYIGAHARETADAFIEIAENYPNLSEDKFLKLLQDKIDEKSFQKVEHILSNFEKEAIKSSDYKILTDVAERVREYINQGKFNDFGFTNLFYKVFVGGKNRYDHIPKAVYMLTADLKKVCFENTIAKPNEFDIQKDKNPLVSVIFSIFKADVATVDHMYPLDKQGENSIYNYFGLCKMCNVLKSNLSPLSWMNQNPEVITYFPQQMKVVDQLSSQGLIQGYDDWSEKVAQNLYEHTLHYFDLRNK